MFTTIKSSTYIQLLTINYWLYTLWMDELLSPLLRNIQKLLFDFKIFYKIVM